MPVAPSDASEDRACWCGNPYQCSLEVFRVRSKFTALGLHHLNDVSRAHCADDVLENMDTCIFEDIEQKWHSELWNDQRRNRCGNELRPDRNFKNDFSKEP